MRIAYVGHPNSPNAWYRAIGPVAALAERGHEPVCVMPEAGHFRGELIRGCDALLVHRFCSPEVLEAARYANLAGIGVVWDNDDDLHAVPKGDPSYRQVGGRNAAPIRAAVKRIVGLADVVTTPSAVLAEQFRALGAVDVRVIENHVRDESVGARSRASSRANGGDELLVGWIAGTEHRVDVEQLPIAAALQELLGRHPGVRVTTVGAWLGIHDDRYEHVDRVLFKDLDATAARFDVALAPIADIPFNRARSNVKVKEYAVVGVPWLASPIGPYAGMGEEQGGRLVADDAWTEEISALIADRRARRKLAKRALRWGRTQTISANVGAWAGALEDAVARARSREVRRDASAARSARMPRAGQRARRG